MAYAAATSPGVAPSQRISPRNNYRRIILRGAAIGLGAVATASAIGAAVTIAAGWVVAVSIGARANIQIARPIAWQPAPLADWLRPPEGSADHVSMAQNSVSPINVPINVPNLNLYVESVPVRIAIASSADSDPAYTGALATPPMRASEAADAVRLPRSRPQLALSIEPKSAFEAPDRPVAPSSRTAVYDIEARTVYMPNGDRLEAHSGLGDWMDDPSSVKVKNRGVTPPNTYELTLRESLFHGVQAIRLNPVDEGKMFGRDGILAHSYMLGPNGQSNGCVSFRDYPKFLRAFMRGEVDRIVVVSHLGTTPVRAARTHVRHVDRYALNNRKPYDFREDHAAVR